MHPLFNGSQVEERPARKATSGIKGYFSESNDNNVPSYPGADYFNDQIDEFLNALSAAGITYDETKTDHLVQLFLANGNQFAPYSSGRIYQCGEVCYTITAGKVTFWEWYSNTESLAGKDPLDSLNRQSGWTDDTKPFYWTPYKKARAGTPLWPWLSETFPEGTLNVVGNSVPTAVFWRLAEAFPEYVNGSNIDFPETGGEFFRVLDQGRGVDSGRTIGSSQVDQIKTSSFIVRSDAGGSDLVSQGTGEFTISETAGSITLDGNSTGQAQNLVTLGDGNDTHPRNLAFPILVEV